MTFAPDPLLTAELIKAGLAQGKLPYATVSSDSMSPLLRQGDKVQIATANAASLKPGTVILLASSDGLFVHRYWKTSLQPEGAFFITRGDRLPGFDPPTPEDCLVGQIIARRRDSRRLSLTNGPGSWLNSQLATISRWDAHLRKIDGDEKGIASMGPDGHHYGQQDMGARFAGRLLHILAILLTVLVNATTKS